MLKVYVKPSSIWLYPYTLRQVPFIEKSLGIFDEFTHKYSYFMYNFDKEDGQKYGVMKIPKGMGVDTIETALTENGLPFEMVNHSDVYPTPRKVDIPMKLEPRSEIQEEAIAFLDSNAVKHQSFLALDVGMGKTYCTIKHISNAKKAAMIISFNLSYQWRERIAEYTELEDSDVIQIAGTQYLEDVIHKRIHPNAKIYLVTINTLVKLMDMYGYEEIQKLADILGIGIKVFDEAHTRYKMFNSIDLNMQVDETIYLTATPGRSRRVEDKMYAKIYRAVDSYGTFTAKLNNHYIINYINIDSKATSADRATFRTRRGLSSLKYTRYLFDKYFDEVCRLTMKLALPLLKEDNETRVLIVTDWLQDIQAIEKWINKRYPEYSVGTYCNLVTKKSERENELNARIIIGTVGSMQNGKDIPVLRLIVPLTQYSSPIVARQLLGRLRPVEGKHVYYYDIADISVPEIMTQRYNRDQVFKDRAANEIREERIDLDRF